MKTARQLQDMMTNHLRRGQNCIYLCHSVLGCQYTYELMMTIYQLQDKSHIHRALQFRKATVHFHSTSKPPHTLDGKQGLIIADHDAFCDPSYQENHYIGYYERIAHSEQRYLPNG